MQKLNEIKILKQKLFKTKTKKAQLKIVNQINDLERECYSYFADIADQLDGQHCTGSIRCIDNDQGTGLVTWNDKIVWLNACNAVNACTWFDHTCCVEFNEGQEVQFILRCEPDIDGITFYATKVQGGYQNLEKFNELNKNKDLAFVCLKGQESGLFK